MQDTTQKRRPQRVADLRRGDKVSGLVLLVETSNFKQTRNQKYFIQMSLRDRTGAIRSLRWESSQAEYDSFGADDFLRVNGRVEEFQGSLQLIVDRMVKVSPESVDFSDYLPASERDLDEMEGELRGAIARVSSGPLRALLASVVDDPKIRPGLRQCPAGKTLHHACLGGLLEHIVSLLKMVHHVCDEYPQLNRDILIAGAILHDIGKIEELSYVSSFAYTNPGQLLGHIAIGLVMVREKAETIPALPPETLLEVEHIIVSHHGLPEYGALKLPMTAEAITFHYLDNLDAKLATLADIEKEGGGEPAQAGEGRWSEYKPHLGRRLYFPERRNLNADG